MKWHLRFLELADLVASWSKDTSTQCGSVVVGDGRRILSVGYNGMPRGANDDAPERHERPEKYYWMSHSEENAVANAAANGIPLAGATLYLGANIPICMACARMIVQAGIRCVVTRQWDDAHPRWGADGVRTRVLFRECGVDHIEVVSLHPEAL